MWKEPSPDFKLSSATLGLKAPFYVNLGVSLNTVCTPVQSSKIPSQEEQRRAQGWNLGLWFGGVGEVGEGFRDVQLGNLDQSMKTLWFILMKLTSSHWISALGYVGFKGKHWLLLLGD